MKKNQLDWLSWEWLIKVMFLLFFSIGTTHTTWAQSQLKITGNVVDTQGEPIIGASVVVKGTSLPRIRPEGPSRSSSPSRALRTP